MQENAALKEQLSQLTDEIANFKEQLPTEAAMAKTVKKIAAVLQVQTKQLMSMKMISNSTATSMTALQTSATKPETRYHNIEQSMKKIWDKTESLASAIDAAEMYSYQYNLKIVGLLQTTQ